METILQVNDLTGGYHSRKKVLNGISFTVGEGEIVGLIGLNGAGKSTTIKHILGLMEPMSGSITIYGQTFQQNRDQYRSYLSYIPEIPILYDELTLWEHLELAAMAYNVPKEEFERKANWLLTEYKMEKMKKWFPSHFSKGMRQKVMIMCAFIVNPKLYIVDEPIVGLDPIGIRTFLEYIVEMRNDGAGILMSTHILSTAEKYCDRFIILHEGRIVLEGTIREMREKIGMKNATLDDIYVEVTKDDRR